MDNGLAPATPPIEIVVIVRIEAADQQLATPLQTTLIFVYTYKVMFSLRAWILVILYK